MIDGVAPRPIQRWLADHRVAVRCILALLAVAATTVLLLVFGSLKLLSVVLVIDVACFAANFLSLSHICRYVDRWDEVHLVN